MLAYFLFRVGSLLATALPSALGYRFAALAGEFSFRWHGQRRRNVLANLRQALGPDTPQVDLVRLARGVFRNGAANYFELLRLPLLSLSSLEGQVQLHGFEHLERAVAQRQGVILVSAHLGCFEKVTQVLASRNIPTVVPVERIRPPQLLHFVTSLRSSHGLRFIPADVGVMFTLVKALRRGEVIGLAVDRDVRGDGLPLEFFGAVTTFQTGAATLARRIGCPVIMAFALRRPDNTADVFVEPLTDIMVTDDAERDLENNLTRMLAVVAKYIRAYPDQWVAFEPVWPEARSDDAAA